MKKFLSAVVLLVLTVSILVSCGCSEETLIEEETQSSTEETIELNSVAAGSEADVAVRRVVGEFLDNFISCDFENIQASLHEDDKWLFNFEDEDQMSFYKTIFPLVSYSFEDVKEHNGVYGIMTNIKSPDMADVYGSVITEYIDSSITNASSELEFSDNLTKRMLDLIASPETAQREGKLFIYVEYINGEYVPRCDAYLANELTGGAPEASDEISSTINETVDALSE